MTRSMTVLLRLVRFTPGWFTLTLVFDFFTFVLVPIPLGLATRAFFDALSGKADLNPWTAIVVYASVQLGALFIGPLLANPWNAMQQKAQVLLQRNLFAGVMRGYGRHGVPVSVAEAISLFRDDPRAMADTLDAVADLICRLIFAAGAGFLMWRIHPVLTVVLFVPLLLISLVAQIFGERTSRYHAASREATARLTGFLGELLAAQLAVKVAGATPHAIARLSEMGDVRRRMSLRNAVFEEAINAIHFHLAHVATGVVLLLGAREISNGTFTVGDFALFVVFLDQLMYLPTEVARVIGDLRRIDVSMGRMRELVPGEPPEDLARSAPVYLRGAMPTLPPAPEREPLERLDVHGLTSAHASGDSAISNVSFALERGSFTVITGRIGAGKTTLLHVLLGLLPRDAGTITWNGRPVEDPETFFVPPRSAFTPQVPRLFSETLRENLLLGRPDDATALDAAIHAAVLESDVATLEHGLDTLVGPRGVKLSGGQVQRAAAARMFLRSAELLVFDDLSSALDAETEGELWTRLFARGRDVTCLVVSHRPAALRRADQVLLMDGGRLVSRGTLDELLTSSAEMQRLWQHEQYPLGSNWEVR
jgi:ABC-type multidrug transport system fused ATPase/permease subunit